MDFRLLGTFRTVIETRSVTGAAAAIGVTQPAVSTQIARLEEEVGFTLFDRVNGRLRPTPEALLFYAETAKVMGGIERLAGLADDLREARAGRLTIASHPSAAISLLPDLVAEFTRERPEVAVRMIARDSSVVRNLLPVESFDIGIAEWPISEAEVQVDRHRLRAVAILPEGDALSEHEAITPELLSGRPFVATYRAHMLHHRIGAAFSERGAAWEVRTEVEFFASACALVARGAGVAVVDPLSAGHHEKLGLVVRPFEPAIFYDFGVFRSRDRDLSVVAQAFYEFLTRHLREQGSGDPS